MQTFVYEPFWYGHDRIDFISRTGVAGEWFDVAYSLRYGRWKGKATTGVFLRDLIGEWHVETVAPRIWDAEWETLELKATKLSIKSLNANVSVSLKENP